MKTIILFLLQSIPMIVLGQNLVQNGDFEKYKKCPRDITGKKLYLKEEVTLIKGTPDYFNGCSPILNGATNPFGYQISQSGTGHMGLYLTSDYKNECDAREYIQLKLTESLIAGHKYDLSFYLSLANESGYSTDQVGVVFSPYSLKKVGISKYIGHPHLNNKENNFLADTISWMPFSKTYNAKGGEEYLIIGNFQKCNYTSRKLIHPVDSAGTMDNMKRKYRKDLRKSFTHLQTEFDFVDASKLAYYFIDNVQLVSSPLNDSVQFVKSESRCFINADSLTRSNNIINDPSFDLNVKRTNEVWNSPTKGTPDFEHGHAGIYLYSGNDSNNREYIISKLDSAIHPCKKYYFKMKVKRSGGHQFAADRIGIAFSDSNFYQNNRSLLPLTPSYQTQKFEVIESSSEWIEFCDTIYPSNCGNYIVIGNFSDDESTFIFPISAASGESPYAHYLIDDLQLHYIETNANCDIVCQPELDSIPTNQNAPNTIPLDYVQMDTPTFYFATNQYLLTQLPSALVSDIIAYLKSDTNKAILIQGHSDSSGPENQNLTLSKLRAESIFNLLKDAGVSSSQMKLLYKGSTQPKTSNKTPQGRAQNRRVEILFR